MLKGLGSQIEKDSVLDKYRKPELNAVFFEGCSDLTNKFLSALPYSLTPSQLTVVSEIIWELKRPVSRIVSCRSGKGNAKFSFGIDG